MTTGHIFDMDKLVADLKREEKFSPRPYPDTTGHLTIGYGWNLDSVPMPEQVAGLMLIHQILDAQSALDIHLPWWRELDPVRQRVLMDMCFNMGIGSVESGHGLLTFEITLRHIKEGEYDAAADGMLHSKWANQVKGRAVRLAEMMRTGRDMPASSDGGQL